MPSRSRCACGARPTRSMRHCDCRNWCVQCHQPLISRGVHPVSIEIWLAFVAASAVLLIIPGPTILTVISYSMAHGRRANVPLVAAVALGDSTALVVSLLGLGALLATSAFWFTWSSGSAACTCSTSASSCCAPASPPPSGGAGRAGLALAAVRQHLAGDGPQPQGHRVLRGLPAAVHPAGRGRLAPALDARPHLRGDGDAQRHALCGVRCPRRGAC